MFVVYSNMTSILVTTKENEQEAVKKWQGEDNLTYERVELDAKALGLRISVDNREWTVDPCIDEPTNL